jgi:hypothetical protein
MASRFQQQALLRKVVYLVLILVLLTGSLLLRRMVVIPQAYNLQLREEARGEVDLTTSAVQLALTGSRGLTTCVLWLGAIEKQRKHEWNEMELLVRSITKVQPYFVSPWLFQSWNLSFNVAVECDRVRDKYFYISRGLELLAEGERRNQGGELLAAGESKRLRFPGNPEMRFYMGFTYQLKVGQGDEKDALRCLYDMSCIDPADRDAEAFWVAGEQGQEVDLEKFEKFCKHYPRLVRRLRESALGLDSPRLVVNFLRDNRDVPSRFEKLRAMSGAERQPTRLKPLLERFPILPPPPVEVIRLQGAKDRDKIDDAPAGEDFDVFAACRLWYEYAQQPLPPPNPDPGVRDQEFARKHLNPLLHRLPKMSQHIFRSYPARAQAYHAENLEAEGWFDADGWLIKEWFDQLPGRTEVRVGTESKYHAGPAWDRAYRLYKEYGIQNGLYLSTAQERELTEAARPYLAKHDVDLGRAPDELSSRDQQAGLRAAYEAAMKLKWNGHYRQLTNYDSYLHQTLAERLPQAVASRKAFFQAERLRRFEAAPEQALATYEEALPQWLDFLLAHPDFARISDVQEETYEAQMRYLRLIQGQRDTQLKPTVTGLAQLALVLPVPLHRAPTYSDEQAKIIPIRNVRGPLEFVYGFDRPGLDDFRQVLFEMTQKAVRPPLVVSPELQRWMTSRTLVTIKAREPQTTSFLPGWMPLIYDDVIQQVRDRLGITRAQTGQPAAAPAPQPRKRR